jgi:hypothetical protein
MTLRPLSDVSAADWFVNDEAPLILRANLGPSGFAAYARVLHGWGGNAAGSKDDRWEGHLDDPLLKALCQDLAIHTTTPDDCFFGLWDGYGDLYGGESAGFLTAFAGPVPWPARPFRKARPKESPPPAFPASVLDGPKVDNSYLLFGGKLSEAGDWGAADWGHGIRRAVNSPNLMWPADRAWFVTTNIDGTWTGIGGSTELIDDLLRDPRLEVVRTRYDQEALR